jgi:palmitoyltransferase
MAMGPGTAANRAANIWTARIIPVLLLAIIGYASYAVTKEECIDYLLRPSASSGLQPRTGTAIAILTIFYILLCLLLVSYARLVSTILLNPGVVPRGPQWYVEREQRRKVEKRGTEKTVEEDTDSGQGVSAKGTLPDAESYRVQDFWLKDVFVCQWDGRPRFCSHCYNYKVDRVHHCSELNRCVYKMDHFCPWVGGVVSETSFKFFIQFTFWTGVFCFFNVVHISYFLRQRQRHFSGVNVHWILALALSALFLLFGMGMCGSSLEFAFRNTTTIDNYDRRSHVYYIAVHVPHTTFERLTQAQRDSIRWITYPRPPSEQLHLLEDNGANYPQPGSEVQTQQPQDLNGAQQIAAARTQTQTQRTFAILEAEPGANPYDLGPFNNLKTVMGNSVLEWLSPIHHSPCTQQRPRSPQSLYKMGPLVYKLKKRAGIAEEGDRQRYGAGKGKRKRRRKPASPTETPHHEE